MNEIYIGKIVNTHGIKGEVRILSDFPYKEQVFHRGTKIYIGKKRIGKIITSYRRHKIYDMVVLDGIDTIDDALEYKGCAVYIHRDEVRIDGIVDEDYIGLQVFSKQDYKGEIVEKRKGKQDLLVVRKGQKQFLIPNVSAFVKKIDLKNKKIEIEEIEGLFDEN